MLYFSSNRLYAVMIKEFIQICRDRGTFAMIIGIPLVQLVLFGYAINSNPKHLPTVVVNGDHSYISREFINALQNTAYFKITHNDASEREGEYSLATGKAQFVISIPPNFTYALIRGQRPKLLITADATDPAAISSALLAVNGLREVLFNQTFMHALQYLSPEPLPFKLLVHAKYNPEGITQYQIVPGLIGVVLTMTMSMITTIAITREHERGTMEGLLSTPVRPIEVMLGKMFPYIAIGYLQQVFIIFLAVVLFSVPNRGSFLLLLIAALPFIIANLMIGIMFSTFARNQLQAMQMTTFYFLPSILLSGFMFPFYGMPYWAQVIGEMLPLTHFLRIVRGIMLKGNSLSTIWPEIWPIIVFAIATILIGLKRYRSTLD